MGDDGAVEDETIPSTGGTGPGGDAAARGWAVPGAAEQQPVADTGAPVDGRAGRPGRADASGAGGGWGAPTDERPGTPMVGPGAGAVPDVVLRPMTAADILDGGFAVLKARPRRILAVTALFVVPTQLVAAFLRRDAMGGFGFAELFSEDPTVLNEQAGDPTADMLAGLLVSVIPAIALVCVAAAIGHLVSQWIMGRDAPAGEMLGVIGRRWLALLGSFVVVKLAEGVGVFGCYIGIVFIMALFVAIVSTLLGNALSALPQAVAGWIGYDEAWPLLALGAILAQIVVLPFVAATAVLQYFDLRVRTEGLDLEMSAIDLFDRAG